MPDIEQIVPEVSLLSEGRNNCQDYTTGLAGFNQRVDGNVSILRLVSKVFFIVSFER
jgi:hypothetical protein